MAGFNSFLFMREQIVGSTFWKKVTYRVAEENVNEKKLYT
jgi:hypothetical protein